MSRFLAGALRAVTPYTPGEQPRGVETLIKLNTNENPYPPSPKVLEALNGRAAENGKPLLGICLGMQLLFEKSYEYGEHAGLGLLPGSVCPLEPDLAAAGFSYKVPHIGWNSLHLVRPENPLMANTREGDFVYFVHSFYAKGCGDALVAGAEYGVTVPGAVARGNVYGCQFHPEKSGEAGLRILRAFAAL